MSLTINNTTINTRLTIVFDAEGNFDGDGPRLGTGNTESDVHIDNDSWFNIRSHTEIPEEVHCLHCTNQNGTWTFELQHTDDRQHIYYQNQSELPQWVSNVVIRTEAQKEWQDAYEANVAQQNMAITNNPDFEHDEELAVNAANTARVTYLSNHGITY